MGPPSGAGVAASGGGLGLGWGLAGFCDEARSWVGSAASRAGCGELLDDGGGLVGPLAMSACGLLRAFRDVTMSW